MRSLAWRAGMSNPAWFKRLGGTVGLSSVGMFGAGGGWGIPIAPPTLMITVGGIATKPRYVNGDLEPRELLDLTISVDHAVVDGATAARFTRRLTGLLERPIDLAEHEIHTETGATSSNPSNAM
jgi:pyruvate/2-oxoglutarate dehydrogenase complex dihydrolipoamide acyltransferase (E2) component